MIVEINRISVCLENDDDDVVLLAFLIPLT